MYKTRTISAAINAANKLAARLDFYHSQSMDYKLYTICENPAYGCVNSVFLDQPFPYFYIYSKDYF